MLGQTKAVKVLNNKDSKGFRIRGAMIIPDSLRLVVVVGASVVSEVVDRLTLSSLEPPVQAAGLRTSGVPTMYPPTAQRSDTDNRYFLMC